MVNVCSETELSLTLTVQNMPPFFFRTCALPFQETSAATLPTNIPFAFIVAEVPNVTRLVSGKFRFPDESTIQALFRRFCSLSIDVASRAESCRVSAAELGSTNFEASYSAR